MKLKYILAVLLLLLTFSNTVYADGIAGGGEIDDNIKVGYWTYGDPIYSASEISNELQRQLDVKIETANSVSRVFYETIGQVSVPIATFFYVLNTWIGETIFLVRLVFWFLIIFMVQYIVLYIVNKATRIIIKLFMLVMFIMNSDNILDNIEQTDKFGKELSKDLSKRAKKSVNTYKKLRHILKELT